MADPKSLSAFVFEGHGVVRATLGPDGEPWFAGLDLCRLLEIRKPHQALNRLKKHEKGYLEVGTPKGLQSMIIVSEPGVWRLIFSSRKPEAERIQDWVYHQVMPALRLGGYHITHRLENLDHASARVATASLNAACRVVDTIRRTHGSLVAAKTAPQVLAKVGITIAGQPAQGELDLKVVAGTDF